MHPPDESSENNLSYRRSVVYFRYVYYIASATSYAGILQKHTHAKIKNFSFTRR